jgi:3-hydroxyisobutyrate dehydrogenase/2-hydroxy-3-oxopropionate reductase
VSGRPVVGFAGLGRMGSAMARTVAAAGFPLVVWNRSPERCAPLVAAGAEQVAEPAGLADADVVVTMVSDGPAAEAVLHEGGLLAALAPGAIVLEMSTIGPSAAIALAAAAREHGVELLDAPVSGSVTVAEAAQLYAMVGGDPAAYARVTPVLDAMTKGHVLLGPSGAGAAMKLALNAMIAVTGQSIAETLVLAERAGIAREAAYDVLASGALASPFVRYKRGAFLHPDGQAAAFTADLMHKDAELADELAARLGVRMPAAAAAREVLAEAVGAGLGGEDMAVVLRVLGAAAENATTEER